MSANIIALHRVDTKSEHFHAVKAEMAERGECQIICVYHEQSGFWLACEGSHRLAAAKELGIDVEIIDADDLESVTTDFDGVIESKTAAELLDMLGTVDHINTAPMYQGVW